MAAVAGSPASETVESDRHAIVLDIEGMTCASCVQRVERALERVPGCRKPR